MLVLAISAPQYCAGLLEIPAKICAMCSALVRAARRTSWQLERCASCVEGRWSRPPEHNFEERINPTFEHLVFGNQLWTPTYMICKTEAGRADLQAWSSMMYTLCSYTVIELYALL